MENQALAAPQAAKGMQGKEMAMTSAVSVRPTSPGHILVAAVSLSLQGFGIK